MYQIPTNIALYIY
ncbi:hypothetical protein G210_5236 [Candida maltosa Xu316]|uniref:Uncharacterized protein n=1 Tax=Candida maltosa (strain Xu316) TaxID=1245528 RepID=M3HD77_CANMX|nr:hypothetical protein G210_5236 [Candida maltosa Xu316]